MSSGISYGVTLWRIALKQAGAAYQGVKAALGQQQHLNPPPAA